jgi:hypothetical protein
LPGIDVWDNYLIQVCFKSLDFIINLDTPRRNIERSSTI